MGGSFDGKDNVRCASFRSHPQASCMKNRARCLQFLDDIMGKDEFHQFHDPFVDHCFCAKCEKKTVWYRGDPPEKYVLPIGWYRFGIKRRDDTEKHWLNMAMKSWPIAYHGSPTNVAASIMNERRIMFPGDKLKNGETLKVRLNNCFADKVAKDGKAIYVSPTITYAGHPNYAVPRKWKDGLAGQTVFQCKVKPKCYKKVRQTLNGKNYDPEIDDNEIEWITADRKGIVPYAVLVKLSPDWN